MHSQATKLRELLQTELLVVSPRDSIQAAAASMARLGVSATPVIDSGRVVGILTEQDISQKAVARGFDPCSTLVANVMNTEPVVISEDRDIESAMLVMRSRHARALIVQDFTGRVLGAISACDLLAEGGAR